MDKDGRKIWNQHHKRLTEIIHKDEYHDQAIDLILAQHALLHSSPNGDITLEDSLLHGLNEHLFRQYPVKSQDTKNSIAWHYWHITRIEDMTTNILIGDDRQVLHEENWCERLNVDLIHSGNDMSESEIAELSRNVDLTALVSYRAAVYKKTQRIVSSLKPGSLKMKVEQERINQLFEEKAVSFTSQWLADYWSKKSIAGLILMPVTRHNFLHLNKSIRIKEKLQKPNSKLEWQLWSGEVT